MSTVRLASAALICCALRIANAHPVAQGAMQVKIAPTLLQIRVTVNLEEISVASVYGGETRNESPAQMAEQHRDYLLRHITVNADEDELKCRAARGPEAVSGNRFSYEFDYQVAPAISSLRIEENVLNEFQFAPGNRWEASYGVEVEDGNTRREGLLLSSRQPLVYQRSTVAQPALDRWQTLRDYAHHGLMHILTGYDHLLFVTALALTVRSLWELVKVVTAFTAAHSITLTLAAFDVLRVPSRIVEPIIALSIVVVALQNVISPQRTHGWTRLMVAFGFGLFHGLGFAGGLLDAMQGMATNSLVVAIVGFSIGVEAGHQVVVLPTFGVLQLARRWLSKSGRGDLQLQFLTRCGSAAISLAGMIYLGAALRG